MKKRISRVLNFVAFNFLFLAIYLNFIHKDSNSQPVFSSSRKNQDIKGTIILSNAPATSAKTSTRALPLVQIN